MAPSSLQTRPSLHAITSATIQPSMACGPPIAAISTGMVMKGPTPIIVDMFKAVAWRRPKRRGSAAGASATVAWVWDVIGRTLQKCLAIETQSFWAPPRTRHFCLHLRRAWLLFGYQPEPCYEYEALTPVLDRHCRRAIRIAGPRGVR